MNAITTIPTNACPPKYRGLSPREECRLRSRRLGGNETPGGLPNSESHAAAIATAVARREMVLAKVAEGFATRSQLRTALNAVTWVDQTIEALVTSGRMKAVRVQNGKPWGLSYRVVAV